MYTELRQSLERGNCKFPSGLGIKISAAQCELRNNEILFRKRRWVPNSEFLRTRLIQKTHDPQLTGHPGKEITYAILARNFFWPNMSADIRRFVRNCLTCRSTSAWRDGLHGLLNPLPVPSQIWREVSMDFVTQLTESRGYTNLLVITDRLSKGVIVKPCKKMDTTAVTDIFIRRFFSQHGIPAGITSDRGTQFVSELWRHICDLLRIQRRLSTAHHPQKTVQLRR